MVQHGAEGVVHGSCASSDSCTVCGSCTMSFGAVRTPARPPAQPAYDMCRGAHTHVQCKGPVAQVGSTTDTQPHALCKPPAACCSVIAAQGSWPLVWRGCRDQSPWYRQCLQPPTANQGTHTAGHAASHVPHTAHPASPVRAAHVRRSTTNQGTLSATPFTTAHCLHKLGPYLLCGAHLCVVGPVKQLVDFVGKLGTWGTRGTDGKETGVSLQSLLSAATMAVMHPSCTLRSQTTNSAPQPTDGGAPNLRGVTGTSHDPRMTMPTSGT